VGDGSARPRGRRRGGPGGAGFGLVVGALGVVYGDIGTSPLYSVQTVFSIDDGAVQPTEQDVFGVVSLVFWSITLIVSVKYVLFVMRADNDGEGGVMALAALARRVLVGATARRAAAVMTLGVLGAALFYGDSVITPAISVLSAIEGVEISSPGLAGLVLPLAAAILNRPGFAGRSDSTEGGFMPAPRKYPEELRERAKRMVAEAREQDPSLSLHAAVTRIGPRVGVQPDTLRTWCRQAEVDDGKRPGVTSSDAAKIKDLEREVKELRRANEILLAASSFFARELDPRLPW